MSISRCHSSPDTATACGVFTVALAGNPNCGKTTVFNALTGLRQKVANYPGVTVEKKTGRCRLSADHWINIIDLPGTYSLISRSPDEQVAMEVLRGLRKDTPPPDVVVVVVDASNLQRNLYLVSQLIELSRPLVIALNMMDIAERRGLSVSPERLEKTLGVPVVPIVGHKRKGIAELKARIANARIAPMPDWPLPEPMKEELMLVGGGLAILESTEDSGLRTESSSTSQSSVLGTQSSIPRFQALAERLLIGDRAGELDEISKRQPVARLLDHATSRLGQLGIDPMQADVEAHYRWIDSVAHAATDQSSIAVPAMGELSGHGRDARATTDTLARTQVLQYATPTRTLTDRVDRVLVHKIWGLLIFAGIMGALFVTIFWLAAPIMDGLSGLITALGGWIASYLPAGPIKDLLTDGIFAGVGAVIVFVPQIALLFLFLSLLEDSGYLARAAFLMDRVLSKVGLHGKSFIPLLSSFACAIPGIMATRTIENRRDRLATIFIAPFMSCSARLPVYTLLIGTFFSAETMHLTRGKASILQAGIMLSLYALGIVAAAGTAWLFKRGKGPRAAFILEMPTYKVPQISQIARHVCTNTWAFLTKAGTIIFCLSVILWAMTYYPRLPEAKVSTIRSVAKAAAMPDARYEVAMRELREKRAGGGTIFKLPWITQHIPEKSDAGYQRWCAQLKDYFSASEEKSSEIVAAGIAERTVAGEQLRYSFAGRFGHAIAPAIKPLGYDWKMGVGLVGAFAAREVFVSTMGIVYSVGDTEQAGTTDLASAMRGDHYADGRAVWTPAVALSLLVWFVLAMQCMSTMAIVRRETGGWKWPLIMLVYMNALAYVTALGVYQVGSRIWS
jgi:ferrous iron transport protein B